MCLAFTKSAVYACWIYAAIILRCKGASRLFKKGYSIEKVAQVTGHRNFNILWQAYTQLFPHKLHDKFNAD